MERTNQKEILFKLRAASTLRLREQPYNLREYLQRAKYHEELGYPDLAAGDAYKALLLTDEVECGEHHVEAGEALWSRREELDDLGNAFGEGQLGVQAWIKSVAHCSAIEAYVTLTQALAACGDLKSAFDFAQKGLKASPVDQRFQKLLEDIVRIHNEKKLSKEVGWGLSKITPKTDLPETGSVKREIYSWNDHEPDRFSPENISLLNIEIKKCAKKCEVLAVDLPLLADDVEPEGKLATGQSSTPPPTIKQLGVFATEDILPSETVLREPSILTANNRLLDPLCDACSALLPPMSLTSPLPTCTECEDIYFCSSTCFERAQQTYHPAICGIENFDIVAKNPCPAAATDALYVLLLARVIAMAETQDVHPLDLPQTKWLWGDFTSPSASIKRKLPFNFQTNIAHPIHILTNIGLDPFAPTTLDRYDTWVFNTLFAKFRGVASAKLNPQTLRPDVAAVHPLWCLANHSCAPNVRWEWGAEDGDFRGGEKGGMGFIARGREDVVQWGISPTGQRKEGGIKKGEEVLNHYCDVKMDVKERREWAAGALGGICQCERCIWEEKEEKNKQVEDGKEGSLMLTPNDVSDSETG